MLGENKLLIVVCFYFIPFISLRFCIAVRRKMSSRSFGQYFQARGVTLGDCPLQGWELDLMLVGPFQLGLFCDSVKY